MVYFSTKDKECFSCFIHTTRHKQNPKCTLQNVEKLRGKIFLTIYDADGNGDMHHAFCKKKNSPVFSDLYISLACIQFSSVSVSEFTPGEGEVLRKVPRIFPI